MEPDSLLADPGLSCPAANEPSSQARKVHPIETEQEIEGIGGGGGNGGGKEGQKESKGKSEFAVIKFHKRENLGQGYLGMWLNLGQGYLGMWLG